MATALRLAEILDELMQRRKLSYMRLAEEIRLAYTKASGQTARKKPIDRRKLKRIIEHAGSATPLTLSVKELEALDAYLAPLGHGLAEHGLFRREGMLHALAEQEIAFFLGARSRPDVNRHDLSVWDVQAFGALLTGINKIGPSTRFDLQDVILNPTTSEALRSRLARLGPGTSVCSIGSPRSCLMSELMLAEMFGIGDQAFKQDRRSSHDLPFYFVWSPQNEIPSRFTLKWNQLADPEVARQVKEDKAYAFQWRDNHAERVGSARKLVKADMRAVPDDAEHVVKDYGVVVAQRRDEGEVWLVVAGLSGPGTYAAAKVLEALETRFTPTLPQVQTAEPQRTLYAVVEAVVAVRNPETPGDRRDVIAHNVIAGPQYWPPAAADPRR